MRKSALTGIITIVSCLMYGSAMAQTYPQVSVPNTEARTLQSEIMDYEYGVYVTLPSGYRNNPGRTYPTLYIIDGNQYYVYTSEPYGSMIWGNMVKEHIAVSVAYPPGAPNMRSRDFQTTQRAADFIRFFTEELIPFVESNYRTSKEDRTLFGHSLGGQFTLYTLLTHTDTFENYIASAPAVNADIMAFEEAYAASHGDLPVTFFLAAGEDDHLTIGSLKFVEQFKTRTYPGLKFDTLFTVNGNHGTIQPSAYIEGLRFVLDPALDLAPEQFKRLTGTYTDGDDTFTITWNGGGFLSFDGVPGSFDAPMVEWRRIYPHSDTTFFAKGWPGEFEFGGDLSAPAATFSFTDSGRDIVAKRQR